MEDAPPVDLQAESQHMSTEQEVLVSFENNVPSAIDAANNIFHEESGIGNRKSDF